MADGTGIPTGRVGSCHNHLKPFLLEGFFILYLLAYFLRQILFPLTFFLTIIIFTIKELFEFTDSTYRTSGEFAIRQEECFRYRKYSSR